ncbi:hypothetical protein CONLIGDRAFT_141281 [Coniochaeta ligniaria NRRL 30616]|uniref:CHAT domain-containing protein n=1 Tax=Coniochaeta ligniaria NRRL 30616 TaxID=1408157 RepID=A0A1J7I8F2_9PEZI|nr:hypothetical protein CONLIGDRAFT_141281 [Coniochaeta ligniaria NRRL 30616]
MAPEGKPDPKGQKRAGQPFGQPGRTAASGSSSTHGNGNDIEEALKRMPQAELLRFADRFAEVTAQRSAAGDLESGLATALFRLLRCGSGGEETDRIVSDILSTTDRAIEASAPGTRLRARALLTRAVAQGVKIRYLSGADAEKEALVDSTILAFEDVQAAAGALGPMEISMLHAEMRRAKESKAALHSVRRHLDEAIDACRASLAAGPDDSSESRSEKLDDAVRLLCRRILLPSCQPGDLDEAIKYSEEWLELADISRAAGRGAATQRPDKPKWLDCLTIGSLYARRYGAKGAEPDLRGALGCHRRAALSDAESSQLWDEPTRLARYLHLLDDGLRTLDPRSEFLPDLNLAISRATMKLSPTLLHDPTGGGLVDALIAAHVVRCTYVGGNEPLDEFAALKKWLDSMSNIYDYRCQAICGLATALFERFITTGRPEDIAQAVAVSEEGVRLFSNDPRAALIFGVALMASPLASPTERDETYQAQVARAADLLESHVSLGEQRPDKTKISPSYVLTLLLVRKYELSQDVADLTRRIRFLSKFAEANPDREVVLQNLSDSLLDRFEVDEEKYCGDLDECIRIGAAVIALPVGDTDTRVDSLIHLGVKYRTRFRRSGDSHDKNRAISCFRTAYEDEDAMELQHIEAGIELSKELEGPGGWDEAARVLTHCVSLVPELGSRVSGLEVRESLLEKFPHMTTSCAAVIMNAADEAEQQGREPTFPHVSALEYLEMGCSVMSALAIEEAELETVRHRYPDLARRFEAARKAMHDLAPVLEKRLFLGIVSQRPRLADDHKQRRQQAQTHYHNVLQEIHAKAGLRHVFKHPTIRDMMEAAGDGAIVVINFNIIRTDAFLIRRHQCSSIRLPGAEQEEIGDLLRMLKSDAGLLAFVLWAIWTRVAEPILDCLGFTGPPAPGEKWPRVWWVMTGMFRILPIHALGDHVPDSTSSVMDRVMSSYSSSVRWLIHSRRLARFAKRQQPEAPDTSAAPTTQTALLVAMPTTPAGPQGEQIQPLSHARREIEQVEATLKGRAGFTTVHLPENRRSHCLKQLQACNIFHFAGHGDVISGAPSQSRLLLDDWASEPLTIRDLAGIQALSEAEAAAASAAGGKERKSTQQAGPGLPFLAYLSACETASDRSSKLGDEGFHMAMGMQLAGFRHVIGAIWPVWDVYCIQVATGFYQSLPDGPISDDAVCLALHQSIRAMRQRDYDRRARALEPNGKGRSEDVSGQTEAAAGAAGSRRARDAADADMDTAVDDDDAEAATRLASVAAEVLGGHVVRSGGPTRLTHAFELDDDDDDASCDGDARDGKLTELKARKWNPWIKPVYWASYVHYGI